MPSKPNNRRSFLTKGVGSLAAAFWADDVLDALPQNTNTNSKPSDLKITDLRMATVNGVPSASRLSASIPIRAFPDTARIVTAPARNMRCC